MRGDGLRAALMHWDGQLIDDARLVATLARTAAGFGARILTRVRAEEISGTEAALIDTRSEHQIAVRARAVIT